MIWMSVTARDVPSPSTRPSITRTRPSIMQYSAVTRPHVITLMFIGPNMKMCAVTHITAAFLQKIRFSSEKKYYCAMLQNLQCSGIRVRVDRCLWCHSQLLCLNSLCFAVLQINTILFGLHCCWVEDSICVLALLLKSLWDAHCTFSWVNITVRKHFIVVFILRIYSMYAKELNGSVTL